MNVLRSDLLLAFFAVTAFVAIIPIFTYISFASELTPRETLVNHNETGLKLYDSKDRPFFTFYEAKLKKEIPISEIPLLTQQSFIAMEDKDFYSHPGFSLPAIIRSFAEDVQGKSLSYGASTITQQLVKNSLLYPKKSFLRKYQEIVLAQEIERRYSKKDILEMYLNSVYLGEGAFGIEEAANTYFNIPSKKLTLAQSAALAAILPAPSRLSLFRAAEKSHGLFNGSFSEVKLRQKLVLENMVKYGYISEKQKEEALKADLKLQPNRGDLNNTAIHFALMVRQELINKFGEEVVMRSGFKVKTSLDLDLQKYAEKMVAEQVEKLKKNNATNGAAVVIDPKTSEIKALVGSKDWFEETYGKFNIVLSLRPPGSAFKPIVYVRAFEKDLITPATIIKDELTRFANFDEDRFFASFPSKAAALENLNRDPNAYYKPKNYDSKFRGSVTVRRALANSLNVPSVAVLKKLGVEEALDSAQDLGITNLKSPENYGLSLVLGAAEVSLLELTNAYSAFANNGYQGTPTAILEISDKSGDIIYQFKPQQKQVVDESYAFLISSILSDVKTRAEIFGTALNISHTAAVKTGTTEDFKDAWTIGYTPSVVVGVWVGNNFGEPMDGVAGSLGAAPIWKALMEKILAETPEETFDQPEGVVKIATCGLDPEKAPPSSVEYFAKGTEPKKGCLEVPASPKPKPTPVPSPSSSTSPSTASST